MNNLTVNNHPAIWPISNIVILDCDSTLTSVEGIDELARLIELQKKGSASSLAASIAALTKRAMEGDIPLEAVYGKRLSVVNPTQNQVQYIARVYREKAIPDAQQVVTALQAMGVQVFIVSGGLIGPVREFGIWLGIPKEHIYAVDMEYDQLSGKWWRYWEQPGGQNPDANYLAVQPSPLTGTHGKNRVVARIRSEYPGRAMLVGDGLSDLEASPEVDLFIGFGGVVFRKRIAEEAPLYIRVASLAALLPLALGQLGNEAQYTHVWAEGLRAIHANQVSFRDEDTRAVFLSSMRRTVIPE
jgi:phosphoserine phosphatase